MFFFWILENELAGSNLPESEEHINLILSKGIKNIISMDSYFSSDFIGPKVQGKANHLFLHIDNWGIPDEEQTINILNFMSKAIKMNESILIHCLGGCGRTGTLQVMYLMVFKNYTYEHALKLLRSIRSCLVESKKQEEFLENLDIRKYHQLL